MSQDIYLEERYESFEGDLRKLDELIGQLELWSDVYTINHKKEEIRLVEYIELNNNLEELKDAIEETLEALSLEEGQQQRLDAYKEDIANKLKKYEETEKTIHHWVRNIKEVQVFISKSLVLQENKSYIEHILA